MTKRMLRLGEAVSIDVDEVIAVMSTDNYDARCKYAEARDNKKLINGTGRNKALSILILKTGYIAASPYTIEEINKAIENRRKKKEE